MELGEQPNAVDRRRSDDVKDAFRNALRTTQGRAVLWQVLEWAGVYRDPFSGDDAATNYTLGQQSIGRRVIDTLNGIDPMAYPRLMLEIADEMKSAQAANMETDPDDVA